MPVLYRQTFREARWGDVLFVDVYARSGVETLEDLDPELRKLVAVVAERPFERVAIR
jgi:hypothetical protein